MTAPLTAEEIAELRKLDRDGTKDWYDIGLNGVKPVNDRHHIRNNPADHELAIAARNALPRLLDEVEDRRARYGDHLAVMDIAHKDGTAARDWIAQAKKANDEVRTSIKTGVVAGSVPPHLRDWLLHLASLLP